MKLDAKKISLWIKQGKNSSEIAEKLGITEESLEEDIRSSFSIRAVYNCLRELKRNDNAREKETKVIVANKNPEIEEIRSNENQEIEKNIEEVNNKIKVVKERIVYLECKHKQFAEKRLEIRHDLQKRRDFLEDLSRKIEMQKKIIQDCISEINQSSHDMHEINCMISSSKEELKALEEKKKQLSKVELFVYNDGNIEASKDIEIPETWEEKFKYLIFRSELGKFTVEQVRVLAKVLELMKNMSVQLEVIFESQELQSIFESQKL